MKLLVVTSILLFVLQSQASRYRLTDGPYFGGGFNYGLLNLTPANQAESNFRGWGGVVELGNYIDMTSSFGLHIAGEYKFSNYDNIISSDTYMERAKVNTASAKLGILWNSITFGAGFSSVNAKIKNVSSNASSTTTSLSGGLTLYYLNYGFEQKRIRSVIELQYGSGDLDTVKIEEISLGLRLFFLF